MNDLSGYYAVRDQIQTMDLIQWHGKSWVSGIIKWKTGGPETHSGVASRLDIDRVLTLHAVDAGCVPWPLSKLLKEYNGHVFWHPLKEEYRDYAEPAFNWMYDQIGTGYDWTGLFQNLLGPVSANAKAIFCSEYVFLGWQKGVAGQYPKTFESLLEINDSPVPTQMHKIGLYHQIGIQIL